MLVKYKRILEVKRSYDKEVKIKHSNRFRKRNVRIDRYI